MHADADHCERSECTGHAHAEWRDNDQELRAEGGWLQLGSPYDCTRGQLRAPNVWMATDSPGFAVT